MYVSWTCVDRGTVEEPAKRKRFVHMVFVRVGIVRVGIVRVGIVRVGSLLAISVVNSADSGLMPPGYHRFASAKTS
ncbi:MAG: hypothetical protein LBD25_03290 [Coriobacteriales bacterium]|jgi:hypothetical protein|nr:hypothetical protein [Coriobacteriales bacterium]